MQKHFHSEFALWYLTCAHFVLGDRVREGFFLFVCYLHSLLISLNYSELTEGTDSALWIGLNRLDLRSGWEWIGGSPFRYLNWAPGSYDFV